MTTTVEKGVYEYDARVAAIHMLRVNIKSLAAESRIIRKEEQRCGELYRWKLRDHRIGRIRGESRYAGLALAFVRGRSYRSVEQTLRNAGPVDAVKLAKKLQTFTALGNLSAAIAVGDWLRGVVG